MAPPGCSRGGAPLAYTSTAPTGAHPARGAFLRGSRSDTRGSTDASTAERAKMEGPAVPAAADPEATTAAPTSASSSSSSPLKPCLKPGSKLNLGPKPKATSDKRSLAAPTCSSSSLCSSSSSSSSCSADVDRSRLDQQGSHSTRSQRQPCAGRGHMAGSNIAPAKAAVSTGSVAPFNKAATTTSKAPSTAKMSKAMVRKSAAKPSTPSNPSNPTAPSTPSTQVALVAAEPLLVVEASPALAPIVLSTFQELPPDTLTKVLSFLNVRDLVASCALSTQLFNVAASHEHWHWFVMQYFGVYYDDYMRSVQVTDPLRWRRLFIYVRQVHQCVDQKDGITRELPQKLRGCCIMESGKPGERPAPASGDPESPDDLDAQPQKDESSWPSRTLFCPAPRAAAASEAEPEAEAEAETEAAEEALQHSTDNDQSQSRSTIASESTPSPSQRSWHSSIDAASAARGPEPSEASTSASRRPFLDAPGQSTTWPSSTSEATMPADTGTSLSSSTLATSSSGRRKRRRRYRGSLELADNCNIFFWENGRYIQIVQVSDGRVLREIDTGQSFRRFFHRLANIRNRLFVCLNDCIKMWEFTTDGNDPEKPPVTLVCPARGPDHAKARRPLELLVHRRRLILLESFCCLLWDIDTLEFVCFIEHREDLPAPARPLTDPDWPWSSMEFQGLEVQWMGDQIVTWLRNTSKTLKVWTLNGEETVCLSMDAPLKQVDVARVTWVSVKTLDHFILAGLDDQSIVCLWDSKQRFAPVYRFFCGCTEPFDLVLTQDFLAVVNDNEDSNQLELFFWKLWLHPNFEAEAGFDAAQAAHLRQQTVEPGGQPAGASLMTHHGRLEAARMEAEGTRYPLTFPDGTIRNMRDDSNLRYLAWQLRHNARPIKTLAVTDVDAYFASYRNFLNICSFHKSGQESLAVYRSSSLRKKMYFPPAKHTKFEEWLALQMHNDGRVVVHDFRPNQVPFDALPPGQLFGTDRPIITEHRDQR